jgi:DNA adenine methylase
MGSQPAASCPCSALPARFSCVTGRRRACLPIIREEVTISKSRRRRKVGEIGPFLRWAGGKRQIIRKLQASIPLDLEGGTYYEPFLGAGSMFFALNPDKAILSDANAHLVACYHWVRDKPEAVAKSLRQHAKANHEVYYNRIRAQYNASGTSAAQAARFIYLNQTCYGGIFRVNLKGEFNVPFGWKDSHCFPSRLELAAISSRLKKARIRVSGFETALADATEGDFVYLDPPYPPLNGTAYFTHYTMDRFGSEDQCRLAQLFRELHARGCRVMMSNADTTEIRRLYRGFHIDELSVTRFVTIKSCKHAVGELVITNY